MPIPNPYRHQKTQTDGLSVLQMQLVRTLHIEKFQVTHGLQRPLLMLTPLRFSHIHQLLRRGESAIFRAVI